MLRPLVIPLLALLLAGGAANANPAKPLPPQSPGITAPFGLSWGESKERLEQLIAASKAKITERRVLEGRDMWVVEGLKQENLKRTVFYFKNGGLDEVELQFQNPDWTETQYNDFLTQLRIKIERRFGQGRLLTRSKSPVGDVTQVIVGYGWAKGESQLDVIYFSAESGSQVYRTVSLHYKALR